MKKVIGVLALALSITACGNDANNNENTNTVAEENNDNEKVDKQVIEVKPKEENTPAEETEIKENEDDKDEAQVEEAQLGEESTSEDESNYEEVEEEEDEDEKSASPESTMVGQNFFLPYARIVKLTEDGNVVNEIDQEIPTEEASYFNYVKYTNNIFVKEVPLESRYSIVRMNDNSIDTIYEFEENESFRPLGLVDGKIYGFHQFYEDNETSGGKTLIEEKSGIGAFDMDTGEIHDFEATLGESTGTAVVAGDKLQFSMQGDDYPENVYSYDLYELDLTKGYDQEAELVEKDFDLQYLFGQKVFENGNPSWHIRRADNDNLYVDGKEFPFLWAEEGFQEFVGNNIFYFKTDATIDPSQNDYYLAQLSIYDIGTGDKIFDENIRGIKLVDGKLYYISEDREIKSLEVDL